MTTPLGFAAKMATIETTLPNVAVPRGLVAAGEAVAMSIRRGSPERLRNVGRGARVGVRVYPPIRTGAGADVLVRATGPFHLIENPIGAHLIEPRAQGAAINHPLVVPGSESGFAMFVKHPGVKRSSGPFARGVTAARPLVPRIVNTAVVANLAAVI